MGPSTTALPARRRGRLLVRRLRAGVRDTFVLLREFRRALAFFAAAILGSGLLFDALAARAGTLLRSPVEGVYVALTLTFLQPIGQVETGYEVSVALRQRAGASDFHPSAALPLENGDVLVALGGPEEFSRLIHASGG